MVALPTSRFAGVLGLCAGVRDSRLRIARVDGAFVAVVDLHGLVSHLPGRRIAGVSGAGIRVVDLDRLVNHASVRMAGVDGAGVAVVDDNRLARHATTSTVAPSLALAGRRFAAGRARGKRVCHAAVVDAVDLGAGIVGGAVLGKGAL
jgi:hypothetical protein